MYRKCSLYAYFGKRFLQTSLAVVTVSQVLSCSVVHPVPLRLATLLSVTKPYRISEDCKLILESVFAETRRLIDRYHCSARPSSELLYQLSWWCTLVSPAPGNSGVHSLCQTRSQKWILVDVDLEFDLATTFMMPLNGLALCCEQPSSATQ